MSSSSLPIDPLRSEVTFKVKKMGILTVKGSLTMLGVSRHITFPFTFTDNTFSGSASINRTDYGLGGKFPGFIVGKTIQISIISAII